MADAGAAAQRRIAEHHERAEMDARDHSERIERLREVQPEMAALRAAQARQRADSPRPAVR